MLYLDKGYDSIQVMKIFSCYDFIHAIKWFMLFICMLICVMLKFKNDMMLFMYTWYSYVNFQEKEMNYF
jgi:hypothetical protein